MPELFTTVAALNPEVIGICESWGDEDITDSEFNIPGFTMFRSDRETGHRGGGVLLYVKNEMNPVETNMKSKFADQVWCKIRIANGEELLIGVCYRSPNMSLAGKGNDDSLCDLIHEVRGRPLLLMGDYNFPDIDWSLSCGSSAVSQQFVDCIDEAFLTQHVNQATRKNSVLDLVFTSEPDMVDSVSVSSSLGQSDHNMLEWVVQLSPVMSNSERPCLDYSRADFPAMRQALHAVEWANELQGDANEQWLTFASILRQLEAQHVPLKKPNSRKKKAPWMTYKAAKLVDKKHKLYRRYKSKSHPAYMKVAREADIEMRRAKRSFEKKIAKAIDKDRKSFYAYVRNRSRAKTTVGPLINDSKVELQHDEMAEEFNRYFSSVFTIENTADVPTAVPLFRGNEQEKLCDIHIDESLVQKKLEYLRIDKAPGADHLLPRFLVELQNEIVVPVTQIMRCSLASGVVPEDWKVANVTPVHKSGSRSQASNYRPISLTSQICKIFESIMRDAVVQHLEANSLITGSQHGFRKGGSCLSNLLQFLDKVTKSMDEDECIDVIYLDFAKAFDKVPHSRLMEKLDKHGISGKVWDWIREWLRDRRQCVLVNGCQSGWRSVTSGVPQGSVLGPILFLIFINDLECNIRNSVFKFADDTKLVGKVDKDEDRTILQHDLEQLLQWSDRWQMPFNTSKCKIMHMGRANKEFQYSMNGQALEAVSEERDLGVQFTVDLKPSRQCQQAYSKASRVLGMIGRTFSYKSRDVLLRLYKSLVRPHLEFCISAWSPYYSKDKHLLERVQHRFTRMFPGLRQLPYPKRLESLGLWSLEERRNRADLLEVFRMYKGWSTTSFNSMFTLNSNSITRGHSAKILKNRCRLDLRRHFFSERVIDGWNRLPQHAIDSATINSFKSALDRTRTASIGFFTD